MAQCFLRDVLIAVNRGKEVLPVILIRHLGQILDVHMDEAEIIRLEGLHRHLGAVLLGQRKPRYVRVCNSMIIKAFEKRDL